MRKSTKHIIWIISALFSLVLFGCQQNDSSKDTSFDTQPVTENRENTMLEKNQYFMISESDGLFSYTIYDKNHNVIRQMDNLTKEPTIIMVNDQILSITTQAGLGIATSSTYYYDIENDLFSDIYQSVLTQHDNLIVHATSNIVIVEDIFDQNGFYQEISAFQESFSPVVFPFIKAELNESSSVTVTYLSGTEYNEITETFSLETVKSVFPTENITRITFYGYYGDGTAANVPDEAMAEIIQWIQSFTLGDPMEEPIVPGTNTYYIEIAYQDGTILRSGLDLVSVDGVFYQLEKNPIPDCAYEIMWQSQPPA